MHNQLTINAQDVRNFIIMTYIELQQLPQKLQL